MKFRLVESLYLTETHYDKKAIDIIVNSGLFDYETAQKIINSLFRQDIHAFVHSPSWLEKYLKGIARMLVEESNGDKSKASSFLEQCPNVFNYYLEYIKQIRNKLDSDNDKISLDDEFNQKMSYNDVKKKVEEIQDQLDKQSHEQLVDKKFNKDPSYNIIFIDSYDQMNQLFGGHWTGDGSSDAYAGGGGTAWCHANSKNVYNQWTQQGKFRFFVLAKKNWKDIKFNQYTNAEDAKDKYGNSLIAILVKASNGKLQNATLRSNHVGNLIGSADNQYQTYFQLSEIAGFNVEQAVKQELEKRSILKQGNIVHWDGMWVVPQDTQHVIIQDGVKEIRNYAFYNKDNLESVVIPDSVKIIGDNAFDSCEVLTSVNILQQGVISIGNCAFYGCISLPEISIPDTVQKIGLRAFQYCKSLTHIVIPSNVNYIGKDAFSNCDSLEQVKMPKALYDKYANQLYKIGLENALISTYS